MGEHRASIKIEFEFHDVKREYYGFINYTPESCCNMDRRIIDFFNDVYQEGLFKYFEECQKREAEEEKEKIEEHDRAEYERLKAKFEKENENEKVQSEN